MRRNKEHFSITADRFGSLSVPPCVRDVMIFWQLVVASVDYSDGDGNGRFETQNLENAKRILAKLGPPVSLDVEWGHGIHAHASVCPFRNLALGDCYSYTERKSVQELYGLWRFGRVCGTQPVRWILQMRKA